MLERAFTVALIAAAATASYAAGIKETVRLTIAGPGIVQPIEVTDQRLLALSNVFSGAFIGDPATEPPDASLPTYSITFDIQTGTGVKRAAYLVYFARSRWTNDGFVYLPGRGDLRYRRNISTILRGEHDGRWHRAADAWSDALHARLP
jgi:hypothetical protein